MHFALSKQWGHLDFRVWLSLIILAGICLGLFGYKMVTTDKCTGAAITVTGKLTHTEENSKTFFVNEQVSFTATTSTPIVQKIVWNYGDRSITDTGAAVSHIFIKEGNYLVTVSFDGKCTESVNIRIIEGSAGTNGSNAPTLNPIVSNDVVAVGEETIFNTSATAKTYSWSIEEMPEVGRQSTPTAKFIFNRPGNFTISLVLDDGTMHKKMIQVTDPLAQAGPTATLPPSLPMDIPPAPVSPLPMPQKEEPKKEEAKVEPEREEATKPSKTYDQLPTPAIQALLEGITDGKKSIADFDNILCNGAGTKVMANNESTTFAALVNDLKEKKGLPLLKRKRKIQNVKVVRDPANGNCVSILYVDYK